MREGSEGKTGRCFGPFDSVLSAIRNMAEENRFCIVTVRQCCEVLNDHYGLFAGDFEKTATFKELRLYHMRRWDRMEPDEARRVAQLIGLLFSSIDVPNATERKRRRALLLRIVFNARGE